MNSIGKSRPTATSWRTDLKRWLEVPPTVDETTVFTASRHHQVQALDSREGEVLWTRDISDQLLESPKLLDGDTLLVRGKQDGGGSLTGLDSQSGQTKWSRSFSPSWKFDELTQEQGPLVLRRDPLGGTDEEPMLQGLSPESGEPLWEVSPTSKSWGIPVQGAQGRLFVELRDDEQQSIMAVDGVNGSVLWSEPSDVWGQPRPFDDKLLVASRQGVKAREASSGQVSWQHNQELSHEPTLTDQAVVLASQPEGFPGTLLTALSRETGEAMWTHQTAHLSGVSQGPDGQVLCHSYKWGENGKEITALEALDGANGEVKWGLDLGSASVEGLGSDSEGRVTVATARGRRRELLVVDDGQILWRTPVDGKAVAVSGNQDSTAIFDKTGLTLVDPQTGTRQQQFALDSPLANFDGKVSPDGWLTISGIDGEVLGAKLPGAEPIMAPSGRTLGKMRHYRYDIAENDEAKIYADVKPDGEFVIGEDALLIRNPQAGQPGAAVTGEELVGWDADNSAYLSREEMKEASLSLWWDRDFDGVISPRDGVVAMAAEGGRQAVVDLDRQKLEVRTRPIRR